MRYTIFLLSLLVCATPPNNAQQQAQRYHVGAVNADTIWLDEYSREVGRLTEYQSQKGEVDPAEVMQQAWDVVVRKRLILQEAKRRNITLTTVEIDSLLLTSPPDFIRRGITDDKGRFDKDLLRAMLLRPDSLINANTRDLPPERRREERAQFDASMAQLRERIGLMEVERRLRANNESSWRFDTASARNKFFTSTVTALADVLYTPCSRADVQPLLPDLRNYYTSHQAEFTTPTPMRRLAYISWPMVAAPMDSSLFLNNVRTFVSMVTKQKNKRLKDSIWTSVATTTASGSSRLHPDSGSHALFYYHAKGKQVGTAVGPIVHATGVHCLLIDTVFSRKKGAPEIAVRVIISDIEPSKQTIDSILSQVDEAAELYERGLSLNAIADSYGKPINASNWFGPKTKMYGSYRLSQLAFATPVNSACDPIDTPERGTLLAVVTDSIPPGPLPFEACTDRIAAAIRRREQCEQTRSRASAARGMASRLEDGTMILVEKPRDTQVLRGVSITADGMIGSELYDPVATAELLAKPYADLYGPLLGEAGWYTANIVSLHKPVESEFLNWFAQNKNDLEAEQKEQHWNAMLSSLRSSAEIEDERWMYFRY